MKTLREMMDLIESAQAPVAEAYTPTAGELAQDLIGLADSDFNKKYGMSKQQANRYYSSSKLKDQGMAEGKNNIDNKIIHLLTNGIPADAIARKLDIPVEWVHEVAKYNMPDSDIDYNDPRNSTQGRERFGEQGMAEGSASRTCPQCDGSGEDTLDPTKSCRRCGGKGHVPVPKEQGVAEGETSQQYKVAVDCGEDGTFTVKVHAGDKGEALRKAQKIVRNEHDTYPEGARIVGQGVDEDQATARMGLMSAVGSNDNNPADQRRAMAQQAVEQLASKR
jgi:hypothetical protein